MSDVTDFNDSQEHAFADREYRRRMLLASVQGWLRLNASPRWKMVLLLGACAGFVWVVTGLLFFCGLRMTGLPVLVAVMICWPVFVFLVIRVARVEYMRVDLRGNEAYYRSETEIREALENQPLNPKWSRKLESVNVGFQSGIRQGGTAGVAIVIFLILISAGSWLLWNLVYSAPVILSETMVDVFAQKERPMLFRKVQWVDGMKNLWLVSGFHFISLALVIYLLVLFLSLFNPNR